MTKWPWVPHRKQSGSVPSGFPAVSYLMSSSSAIFNTVNALNMVQSGYSPDLTCVHNTVESRHYVLLTGPYPGGVNNVSGVDSVSLWGAYHGILSDPPTSHPWNKHQTPCKPCTKVGYMKPNVIPLTPQGHFVPQLYHKKVCLHWRLLEVGTICLFVSLL